MFYVFYKDNPNLQVPMVRRYQTLREAKRFAARFEKEQPGRAFVAGYFVDGGFVHIYAGWVYNPFRRRWIRCRRVQWVGNSWDCYRAMYALYQSAYMAALPRMGAAA